MIGLVYADYKDPGLSDEFHSLACATFRGISIRYRESVTAVTDPDVTGEALACLIDKSDFIFYWGHAEKAELIGSVYTERLDIRRFGHGMRPKMLYLDGCQIGATVNDADFPYALVIGPTIRVPYETSVHMGCNLVLELLGNGKDFQDAFELAKSCHGRNAPYSLVGQGRPKQVTVCDRARLGVVCGFFELLIAWDKLHRRTPPSG